jgi:multimeric flavodoxin WrbA
MKIVCLLASPRPKGNSTTIANRFLEKAQHLGGEIQRFSLNKLYYRGCQGCMVCKTKIDKCVLEDDLSVVLEAVRGADTLVIASPVYWYDINAQLKAFIDRTFSYLVPDYRTNPKHSRLKQGKKLVFILAQGAENPFDIYPKYKSIFEYLGFEANALIHASGVRDIGDVNSRDDILAAADKSAEKIFS